MKRSRTVQEVLECVNDEVRQWPKVSLEKLVANSDDVYSKDSRSSVQKRIEQPRSLLPIHRTFPTKLPVRSRKEICRKIDIK